MGGLLKKGGFELRSSRWTFGGESCDGGWEWLDGDSEVNNGRNDNDIDIDNDNDNDGDNEPRRLRGGWTPLG